MSDLYLPQTLIKTETAEKQQCKQFVNDFISVLIPSGHVFDDLHKSIETDIKRTMSAPYLLDLDLIETEEAEAGTNCSPSRC